MKYRKKPVVIEAVKYSDIETAYEIQEWLACHSVVISYDGPYILIPTMEGMMRASIGDYIIKGIQGEFYPCKPDIFLATYEVAE